MATRAERDSVELTVRLSPAQLKALSRVAVVVTSAADLVVINAAESGLRAVRDAAAVRVAERPW